MKDIVTKVITTIFGIALFAFMLLGIIIVATQLIAVVLGNGALAVGVTSALKLWSIRFSVVAAFCGFAVSYLKPKASKKQTD